jgi:hypothetical protein
VAEAAAAYRAITDPHEAAWSDLYEEYSHKAGCLLLYGQGPCTAWGWAGAKAYLAAEAALDRAYIGQLRLIPFPDVAASLAAAYIEELVTAQRAEQAAADATTLKEFNRLVAAIDTAKKATDGDEPLSQQLLAVLGLPVGP